MNRRKPSRRPVAAPRSEKSITSNGVTCVAVRAPGLRSAMVALYVGVGSRDEEPALNGVSHFVEHLLFRGTARYPTTLALNVAVENGGGSLNASTGRESTAFYTPIHPAHLATAIRVLAEMVCAPHLDGEELEREIILEEMMDEVDDRGRDIDLDNLAKMQLFGGHGLAQKIAGTPKTVRTFGRAQARAHLDRHYRGGNVVVCAAGDFEPEVLFRACERELANLPGKGPAIRRTRPPLPREPTTRFVEYAESQTELRLSFVGPDEKHADYYPMVMLSRLLDDGLSSRLQREVVEQRALAYSVAAGIDRFTDVSLFDLEAASNPAKAARVLEEFGHVLDALRQETVELDELERAKARHAMALEFALDSTAELCGWYGSGALFGDPDDFTVRRKRLEAVSPADLLRVARRVFRRSNAHLTVVGPHLRGGRRALEHVLQRSLA